MGMPATSAIWVGAENMQKALDTLKGHCAALGRDYDTIEKTALCTVHLAGDDTVDSVINRIKNLAAMGFTHAIFNMPDLNESTPLATFAREIIPAAAETQTDSRRSICRFRPCSLMRVSQRTNWRPVTTRCLHMSVRAGQMRSSYGSRKTNNCGFAPRSRTTSISACG